MNESSYLYGWSNQVIGARMLAQNLYDEINSDGSIKYNKKQILKLLKLLNESKKICQTSYTARAKYIGK